MATSMIDLAVRNRGQVLQNVCVHLQTAGGLPMSVGSGTMT
jgi:hypothetical protein